LTLFVDSAFATRMCSTYLPTYLLAYLLNERTDLLPDASGLNIKHAKYRVALVGQ